VRLATTSFALGFAVALFASRARAAPTDAQPVQPVQSAQPVPVQPAQPVQSVQPAQPPPDVSADARPAAKAEKIGKRAVGFATVALGMPGLAFVNELVGARFELEYKRSFSFGASLAYANLKGKEGRVSNVLPEVSFGYYAPLGKSFGFPIRFSAGYLPKNGPTARLSYGLGFSFSEEVSLELALVEPMIWIARDRPELSFNLGASVLGRF
jgi:hypothetical protein